MAVNIADLKKALLIKDELIQKQQQEIDDHKRSIQELRSKLDQYENIVGMKVAKAIQPRKQRNIAVSAEPRSYDSISAGVQAGVPHNLKTYPKSEKSREVIKQAINSNEYMRELDQDQIEAIIDCMQAVEYNKGSFIIKAGKIGTHVFAIEEGKAEVTNKDGEKVYQLGPGKLFGELAIIYSCKRTANVQAETASKMWMIDRKDFQTIAMATAIKNRAQYTKFLLSVPAFKNLKEDLLGMISDYLEETHFENGEHIIRQFQPGDTFYIISKGKVKVTRLEPGATEPTFKCHLKAGDFFGELALDREEQRNANVIADDPNGVTCLTLEREAYKRFISNSESFQRRIYGKEKTSVPDDIASLRISHLKYVATLGAGGFGRVELVTIGSDNNRAVALKKMKKHHVVETRQQEHVMNEKRILSEIKCDFVIKLYRTFKDTKYVYLLLEVGLGGELWTMLREKKAFDHTATKFYTGCVVEAFAYLHARNIVYRDLKPENLILDSTGYAKLTDFGFAKRLVFGRMTWTFCGTPEYVAPEVILSKGHDTAADLWSLGIFIYELMNGSAPFTANDHMKIYTMILKGIDSLDFPKSMKNSAKKLVKKLCRDVPNERFGYGSNDLKEIRKDKFFEGFDWDRLKKKTLKPPFNIKVKSETDASNFDNYPKDESDPPVDESGWDKDF